MSNFATIEDIEILHRPLNDTEKTKAEKLLEIVSDLLRNEAINVGKDLDKMIEDNPVLKNVAKSVTVDIIIRALNSDSELEAMSQYTQSAGGYTFSGSPLNAGGGIFIKKNELKKLGLRKRKLGVIDLC